MRKDARSPAWRGLRWLLSARPRARVGFTREGRHFLLLMGGLSLGALNTGNNLLYLLVAAMLALLVASFVLARVSLDGLRLERRPPGRLFAGEESTIAVYLTNTKRTLPSVSVVVREDFERGRTLDPLSFSYLAAGEGQSQAYRCVFPRRGRCRFRGFRVETTFPFGLLVRGRFVAVPDLALVFPRVSLPVHLPPARESFGEMAQRHQQGGYEIRGLRPFRLGDDRRQIAWKASAKRRELLVREEAQGLGTAFELVVDNVQQVPPRPAELFESTLDHAASLSVRLLALGHPVALRLRDVQVSCGSGPLHTARLLRTLALARLLTPQEARRLPSASPQAFASPYVVAPLVRSASGHYRPARRHGPADTLVPTSSDGSTEGRA